LRIFGVLHTSAIIHLFIGEERGTSNGGRFIRSIDPLQFSDN
jgi:hypothetical protein